MAAMMSRAVIAPFMLSGTASMPPVAGPAKARPATAVVGRPFHRRRRCSMNRRVDRRAPQAFPSFFEQRVNSRHEHERDEQRGGEAADDDARERHLQLAPFTDAE